MNKWKSLLYMCAAAAMLVYAVPRLSLGGGLASETVFGVVWLCFALLVLCANLYQVLGVDAEKKERMRQVKRMRMFRQSQRVMGTKGRAV